MGKIDIEDLRKHIGYDPETGRLWWKEQLDLRCPVGSQALCSPHNRGYQKGSFKGRYLLAHRVAWAVHFGRWPIALDHINGNKSDNRLSNLREANQTENMRNQRMYRNNKTGCTGVELDPKTGRWRATIKIAGRAIALGKFEHKPDAVAARKAAEIAHGFHPNHGRVVPS